VYQNQEIILGMLANIQLLGFDHSAALCENHLHAIYAGANQVMIPAMDFVRSPARFWKVLSDHRITYTFAPNFFIAAATRAMDEVDSYEKTRMDLDLSELRVIMCGGEANKTATIQAAEKVLTYYGAPKSSIKASYGLTEVSISLEGSQSNQNTRTNLSCRHAQRSFTILNHLHTT
jgi:acyl-CoA synthetase (AMP-forming)/AMP-acid ligase II